MAKVKKAKTPKGKWAIWKTILVVFSAIIFVSGVTIGGVYLAGGFKEKVINPEAIAFVIDSDLYNQEHSQFEVTKDFELTITSPTESVTRKTINLSFNTTGSVQEDFAAGTISDGVITVPKTVNLDQPFTVKLNKSLLTVDENTQEQWITGGISKLRAMSAYEQISPADVQIAVDVPVHSISVDLFDMMGNQITQITSGESFIAKSRFFPEQSKYFYSDDKNETIETKREKLEYFTVIGAGNITFVYDEEGVSFLAGERLRDDNMSNIIGYTFKSADKQVEALKNHNVYEGAELYSVVLSYLASNDEDGVSNVLNPTPIEVVEATIESFVVEQQGLTFNLFNNTPYRITMNNDSLADNYLGAIIRGTTQGSILKSLLKNVAVTFEYELSPGVWRPMTNQLQVSGRKSVEIETIVNFITGETQMLTYYLPNIEVSDLNSAYFDLLATNAVNLRMKVVLLESKSIDEGDNETYTIFDPQKGTYTIFIESQARQEQEVTWNKEEPINLTLGYNGSKIEPKTYIFGEDGNAEGLVPPTNIYQSKKYFAYFGSNVPATATALADKVIGRGGYSRAGLYNISGQDYYLFPLNENEMTVGATENFQIFFATVRTKVVDGQEIYEYEDGLFKIEKATANSIQVNVSKSLYEGSVKGMTSTVTGINNDDTIDNYYIYAGSADKISAIFTFEINEDSVEVFGEKLANTVSLSLLGQEGEDVTNCFNITFPRNGIRTDTQTGETRYFVDIVVTVRPAINISGDVKVVKAKLKEEDSGLEWERDITFFKDGVATGKQMIVYMPQVKSVELIAKVFGTGSATHEIDLSKTIYVKQELLESGEFETTITYFKKGIDTDTPTGIMKSSEDFVNQFQVTVTDNHNNTDVFNNSWSYATTNPSVITINNKTFTFGTSERATAQVYAICGLEESPVRLNFSISSEGIQAIEFDNSKIIGETEWNLGQSKDSVAVSKYGATNKEFYLKNLVKLYTKLVDGKPNTPFNNFMFKFNDVILSQTKDDLVDLFGTNGMLKVYTKDQVGNEIELETAGKTADEILEVLRGTEIVKLKINNSKAGGFASDKELNFVIVDKTGAVNISLTLNILANISAVNTQTEAEVYASVSSQIMGDILLTDKGTEGRNLSIAEVVMNNLNNAKIYLTGRQTNKTIQVNGRPVTVAVRECKLAFGDDVRNVVGNIIDGKVVFNDFWDNETNYYRLVIELEGVENKFALSVTTEYTVKRNIKVVYSENVLEILKENNSISNFFKIERIEETSLPFNFGTTADGKAYAPIVSADRDSIFEISASEFNDTNNSWTGTIQIKSGKVPLFDYHNEVTSGVFHFYIGLPAEGAGEDVLSYSIGEEDLIYELGLEYEKIAQNITRIEENGAAARVETIGGKQYVIAQKGGYNVNSLISTSPVGGAKTFDFDIYQMITVDGKDYRNTFYAADGDLGNRNVSFNTPQFSAIQGLTSEDEKDLIVVFLSGGARRAVAIVPLLVSNIGLDFVHYSNETIGETTNRETVIKTNTLENALTEPSTLFEKGIYEEVTAGEKIQLATKNILGASPTEKGFVMLDADEGSPNYSLSVVPTMNVPTGALPVGQDTIYFPELIKAFDYKENGNIEVQFNHLSDSITTAYVALRAIVSNGSWEMPMYYLLKVNPDIRVNDACYAFDSATQKAGKENLTGKKGEIIGGDTGIDLDEPWGDGTLNKGKTRFSIDKKLTNQDGEIILNKIEGLVYKDRVVSVTVGNNDPYTTEDQYKDILGVELDNGIIRITPKTDSPVKLIIKRVYSGGLKDNELSVVGGEIEYVFEINADADYYLTFSDLSEDTVTDSVDTIKNSEVVVNELNRNDAVWTIQSTAKDERDLLVKLINNTVTQGEVGTEVPNKLSHAFFIVDENGEQTEIQEPDQGVAGLIKSISYNNSTFELKVTRADYVESDKQIIVLFYTEYGLLGQASIIIKASAQASELAQADNVYSGNYNLSDFVDIKKEFQSVSGEYKVNNIKQISGEQKTFKFNNLDKAENTLAENEKQMFFFPAIRDEKFKFEVEIEFVTDGDAELFKFILELDIKKDIVQVTKKQGEAIEVGITSDTAEQLAESSSVIHYAGDKFTILPHQLMRFVNTGLETTASSNFDGHILYTWEGISGGAFVESSTDALSKNIEIQTKNVGTDNTAVNLLITAYLFKDEVNEDSYDYSALFGENGDNHEHYSTFMVQYSFYIQPNVKIGITYPNPTKTQNVKEMLTAEYLKSGAVFAKASDIINNSAVFALSSKDKRISFTAPEKAQYQDVSKFSVKVESLQNVTIYSGMNEPQGTNDVIPEGDRGTLFDNTVTPAIELTNLTFKLGSRNAKGEIVDNGNEAIIRLRIECNGVTEFYKIVLQNSVLTVNVNKANEDEEGVETIYVDKLTAIDGANILTDARLIQFKIVNSTENQTIANIISAPYVLVFENGEDTLFYELREMSRNDIGKILTIDFGSSMAGYEYKGTYVNDVTNFVYDENGKILGFATSTVNGVVTIIAKKTDDKLLYSQVPQFIARIGLSYIAGEKYIPVDYSYINDGNFKFGSKIQGEIGREWTNLSEYGIETDSTNLGTNVVLGRRTEYIDKEDGTTESQDLGHFNFTLNNGQARMMYQDLDEPYCDKCDTKYVKGVEDDFCTQEGCGGKIITQQEVVTTEEGEYYENFSTTYTYRTDIDIDVRDKGVETLKTIDVGQTVKLIQDYYIYHPSNGDLLSKEDLIGENSPKITLQIVGIDKTDVYKTVNGVREPYSDSENESVSESLRQERMEVARFYNQKEVGVEYTMGSDGLLTPYGSNDEVYRFLSISADQETGKPVTNYNIQGYGAKNGGSYVLLYFEYSVTVGSGEASKSYVKKYYLAYKVVPDYVVKFAGVNQNDIDEHQRFSNESTPYVVAPQTGDKTYKDIYIAGSTDNNFENVVQVRHSGTNMPDVAANLFSYTLSPNDNGQYNLRENVKQKMSNSLNHSGWQGWNANASQDITWSITNSSANACVLGSVKVVYIGQQNYKLSAVDKYGYEFFVYFTLDSGRSNPSVSETQFLITENADFGIGAKYEQLAVAIINENGNKVDIQPISITKPSTSEYQMLNIQNLNAWGYVGKPDDKSIRWNDAKKQYEWIAGDNGTFNPAPLDPASDSKYLNIPDFTLVTVQEINFYDSDNTFLAKINALDEHNNGRALTTDEELYFGDGDIDADGKPLSFVNYISPSKSNLYKMAKLPGSVYGSASVATVTMEITMRYASGEDIELFNVSVPAVVSRDVQFVANTNNIVRDGAQFNVSDYLTVYSTSGESANPTYFDDTIKITLPANGRVVLSVTRERDGEIKQSSRNTFENGASYTMTSYTSISGLMGATSEVGDIITIDIIESGTAGLGILDEQGKEKYRGFYVEYANNAMYLGGQKVDETYPLLSTEEGMAETITETINEIPNTYYRFKAGELTMLASSTTIDDKTKGKDEINIVDARRLKAYANKVDIKKYYVALVESTIQNPNGSGDSLTLRAHYQVAPTYSVIPYYHSMSQNIGADVNAVNRYLTIRETAGELSDNDTIIVPRMGWTEGLMLNIARNEYDGIKSIGYDSFNSNTNGKLYYTISPEDGSSGAATIDEYGLVKTTSDFSISSQHFVVKVYLKASGLDGQFDTQSTYDIELGKVTFMLRPPKYESGDVLGSVNGVKNKALIEEVNDDVNRLQTLNIVHKDGEVTTDQEDIDLRAYVGKQVISTVSKVTMPAGMEIKKNGEVYKIEDLNFNLKGGEGKESYVLMKGSQLYMEKSEFNFESATVYKYKPETGEYEVTSDTFDGTITLGVNGEIIDDVYIKTIIKDESDKDKEIFIKITEDERFEALNGQMLQFDLPIEYTENTQAYAPLTNPATGDKVYCKVVLFDENQPNPNATLRKKIVVSQTCNITIASTEGVNHWNCLDENGAIAGTGDIAYCALGSFAFKVNAYEANA